MFRGFKELLLLTEWIVLFILLCVSGFCSGAETAIFSLSAYQQKKLGESGSRSGQVILTLLSEPQKLLTTILVANMLVNTLYASLATWVSIQLAVHYGDGAMIAVDFVALATLIVFSELFPKTLAINFPVQLSPLCAYPLYILKTLLAPLTRMALALDFVSGKKTDRQRVHFSADDLEFIVQEGEQTGIIDANESRMLTEVMWLTGARVKEIMTPVTDMISFDVTHPRSTFLKLVDTEQLTKIPVFQGQRDNIVGILYAKEALLQPDRPLSALLRKPLYVPEAASVEALLKNLRAYDTTVALVVDEYGHLSGIVSLRDVAERIVGEIQEEDEEAEAAVERVGERRYILPGSLNFNDLAGLFNVEYESGGVCTLGGFITALLGRIPTEGEQTTFANLRLTVLKMKRHRIIRVQADLLEEISDSEDR